MSNTQFNRIQEIHHSNIQQANLRLADQLTEVGRMCPPFDGLRKWLWQLLNVTVKGIYLWAKFGVEIRD